MLQLQRISSLRIHQRISHRHRQRVCQCVQTNHALRQAVHSCNEKIKMKVDMSGEIIYKERQ